MILVKFFFKLIFITVKDAIHTMENRNYFSLYCLQMETQLIHSNLNMLIEMLRNMVDVEIKKHIEVEFNLLIF